MPQKNATFSQQFVSYSGSCTIFLTAPLSKIAATLKPLGQHSPILNPPEELSCSHLLAWPFSWCFVRIQTTRISHSPWQRVGMKQVWASAFWDSEAAACLLHAPPCSLFSLWADCNRKSAQTLEDKRCDSSGCSYSYCTQVCVTKNNRDYAARESAFLFQRPQYKIIAVFFRSAFAFSYVFVCLFYHKFPCSSI